MMGGWVMGGWVMNEVSELIRQTERDTNSRDPTT